MSCLCGIIADSLVGKFIECTVELVCRQVGYMFNYEDNIASLTTEFTHLSADKTGMQQQVQLKLNNVEVILANVECWMGDAGHVIEEVDKILKEYGHAKANCSFWSLSCLVRRHGLSKRAKKMAASIVKVRADIPTGPIACSQVLPSCDEVIEGYEAFESRNLVINEIMDALRKPEVQVVGLYGMGGIGKTMLAKEVLRRARLDKFEVDVMVSVSQDQKPKDIQQHIAEKLDLKFHEEMVPVRANKLRQRLSQEEKNVLIILDDVWDKLDLQEIGVPFGNDQKGCKILLTSRSAGVCNIMKAEKSTFNLQVLTPSEASKLFIQIVGELATSPNFKNLANAIIKECAGLPIAIVIVASALKHSGKEVWKVILQELRTATPTNIEEMDTKVYSLVKVSYNYLPNDAAKNLLLLCSLHAEDENIPIEDLVMYGMGLGWFHNITTLKDARICVSQLVVKLKERSLLLGGEGHVKLHDVIRDACLSFASKDKYMHFIRDLTHFKEFIENDKLVEKTTGISMPNEAINYLPPKLKWPHLELFLLRKVSATVEILDEQCFEEMKDLRVMNLTCIKVKQTSFFSSLQKLQTLCLRFCHLGDVAPIGELNKLKILDLSDSNFLKLPKEIGQLTRLQLLDFNCCSNLFYVEPHVFSKLKNLEHLAMMRDYGELDFEVNGIEYTTFLELSDLDKLTTLYIVVRNVDTIPKFWLCNKMDLEKYVISIGHWDTYYWGETSKVLRLMHLKSHQVKAYGLERFIRTATTLQLKGFEDLNDVFELVNNGFQYVEHFFFEGNEGVRYFINASARCRAFSSLKSLFLVEMRNLEKICHGKLISGSFGNLKEVKVYECERLKSLFSFSIARHFEQINVVSCPELQVIGTYENEHETQNAINDSMDETKFCELKTLRLSDLPKLTRFFWPEQEINSVSDRGDGLFNTKDVFSKLREIELFGIKVEKLWLDELHEVSFMKNLTTMKLLFCFGLNYLSSFEVAKSLELLEFLILCDIDALKVVIVVNNQMDEVERTENKLFSKLRILKLTNLPNMAEFCSQCCFEFPSLKVLRINNCPKVVDLDLIGRLSNLEILDLSGSSFVELSRGIERLTQLKTLDLSRCEYLKVIQPDVISKLVHLEELKMLESHVTWGVEGVFSSSASLSELKNLPQLTVLKLSVPDFSFLSKDFFSEKWKECHITTNNGSYVYFSGGYRCSSKLQLHLKNREINVWENGLQVLLNCSEELELDGLEDDIVYELDKEGFPQLRMFSLRSCGGVRYLVNSIRHSCTVAFVSLERLFLLNLTTLERICHGELIRGSFRKLTHLKVVKCARLKSLFPIFVATQLEELEVMDCEAMEAIFTIEKEDDNDLAFTELRRLSLKNLPRLVQFSSKLKTNSTSCWKKSSNEELGIFMPLFDAKVHMPNLRELRLNTIGCKQIWYHQPFPIFNNLEILEVSYCHNLKRLMPYSMVTNLRSLKVRNCENMQELISTEKEEGNLISFNKLETLKLKNLQSLRRFNAVGTVNFPSISKMTLVDCFKLTTFVSGSTKAPQRGTFFGGEVNLPKLERLSVDNCEIIDEIFDLKDQSRLDNNLVIPKPMHTCGKNLHLGIGKGKVQAFQVMVYLSINRCNGLKSLATSSVYFQYLTSLEVSECNSLINLFSSSTVEGMLCLQRITISKCKEMAEIIGNGHEDVVESVIVLKNLSYLKLHDLPNLRCFYSGSSTITFPKLTYLVVSQCFEIKTFSHGIVNSPFLDSIITETKFKEKEEKDDGQEQDWEGNINSTIQKIYEKWRKKSESSSNEQITSEKDTTMGNNEDELSTLLTVLSGGDQVKRVSWKGKQQATKSSSSGSNSGSKSRC